MNLLCSCALQMGLETGREFRAAREAADATGAQVVLGDRPIEVSLQRALAALGFRRRLQLLGGLAQVPMAVAGLLFGRYTQCA